MNFVNKMIVCPLDDYLLAGAMLDLYTPHHHHHHHHIYVSCIHLKYRIVALIKSSFLYEISKSYNLSQCRRVFTLLVLAHSSRVHLRIVSYCKPVPKTLFLFFFFFCTWHSMTVLKLRVSVLIYGKRLYHVHGISGLTMFDNFHFFVKPCCHAKYIV